MSSGAKIIELDASNTCELCDNAFARYSCPKCGIKYCSLPCYRSDKHSECSEEFYKGLVFEELSLEDNEETKRKMMEILDRNKGEELDSDDEDLEDIAERLAGVDLDNADQIWEKLTEDEKQEFMAFVKSQDISKIVQSWTPWWEYSSKPVEDATTAEDYKKNCPELVGIKSFKEISKKDPADCVTFNLVNVISGYVFCCRYFNGEHHDFCKEAVTCLLSISLVLKNNENFDSFDTAVKSVEFQCLQSDWIMTDRENFELMKGDVERVLRGPGESDRKFYVLAALSDLHRLFSEALSKKEKDSGFSKTFPNDHFPKVKLESRNRIRASVKKLEYLSSFAKDRFENEF